MPASHHGIHVRARMQASCPMAHCAALCSACPAASPTSRKRSCGDKRWVQHVPSLPGARPPATCSSRAHAPCPGQSAQPAAAAAARGSPTQHRNTVWQCSHPGPDYRRLRGTYAHTHARTHARRAIAASPSTRTHPLSGRVNNVVHVADVAVQRPQRGCDAHAPRLQCMGRSSRRSLTLSSACTRLQTRGLAWPGQNVRDRHMHAAAATTAGLPHKQAPPTEAHLGASPHDSWHRRLQLLLRHLPRRQRLQPVLL